MTVTVQSTIPLWVWVVVGGFILLLIVANVRRRQGMTCENCGSTERSHDDSHGGGRSSGQGASGSW